MTIPHRTVRMPGFYTRAMAQAQFVLTRTRTRSSKDLELREPTGLGNLETKVQSHYETSAKCIWPVPKHRIPPMGRCGTFQQHRPLPLRTHRPLIFQGTSSRLRDASLLLLRQDRPRQRISGTVFVSVLSTYTIAARPLSGSIFTWNKSSKFRVPGAQPVLLVQITPIWFGV
jgi:hypothetical protein